MTQQSETARRRLAEPIVESARPRLDRKLWVLFLGKLITSTGHSISFPFFAIYCHSILGIPLPLIGAIILTSGLAGAFGRFLGGALADRIGRKPVMLVALAGRAVATAAIGWLAMQPHPAWPAMAVLFIGGNWFGFLFDPACQAMVADLSDVRLRVTGYSVLRVGGNLGWALGAIAGGILGTMGWPLMFFTTSAVIAGAFLLLGLLVAESLRQPRAEWREDAMPVLRCLRTPGYLALLVATMLTGAMMSQLIAPLSVYAKEHLGLSARQAGYFFALNGFIIVLFQFPVARWIGGFRLTTALVAGSLLYAFGYAAAGWAAGFWTLAACVAVVSGGELLVAPSMISLAANVAPEAHRGRYLGIYGFSEMIGRCVGPFLGCSALEWFAQRTWIHWSLVGAVGVAAAAGYFAVRSRVSMRADQGI